MLKESISIGIKIGNDFFYFKSIGYIYRDHCTMFRSEILSTIFRYRGVSVGYDVCVYNSYGHRAISCSGFRRRSESEPYGDRREIVRKS